MIDRFGREVQPIGIFAKPDPRSTNLNPRPMASRSAFGGTVKQTKSILPPWQPRPVSEQIGSPGWSAQPVDTRPASALLSSFGPANRDGTFTRAFARPSTSPPGKRWSTAGPRGSPSRLDRPASALPEATAPGTSSPRFERVPPPPPPDGVWREHRPARPMTSPPGKQPWCTAGPHLSARPYTAVTTPRAKPPPAAKSERRADADFAAGGGFARGVVTAVYGLALR